jgi:hypothetical protein
VLAILGQHDMSNHFEAAPAEAPSPATIPAATNSDFVIEDFKAVTRNSLRGFARIRMPSGMIFHDVVVHHSGETWWAAPAARLVPDKAGKSSWQSIVTFASKAIRDRFSTSVITALRISHPEVFDDECL